MRQQLQVLALQAGRVIRDKEFGEMIPLQRKGTFNVLKASVRTAEGTPFGGLR